MYPIMLWGKVFKIIQSGKKKPPVAPKKNTMELHCIMVTAIETNVDSELIS